MEAQVQYMNVAVRALATELNNSCSPVVAVDQNTGFNVTTDLKADGVHPTRSGFEKLAGRWFVALSAYLGAAS